MGLQLACPKVRRGIVLESLFGRHSGPRLWPLVPPASASLEALAGLGLEFLQFGPAVRLRPDRVRALGLSCVASITWNLFPGDADLERTIGRAQDLGFQSASLLVGGSLLPDDELFRRVERLVEIQERCGFPVVLETHRATITESVPRTLLLARRFCTLRFNLDLSHWFVTHRLDRIPPAAFVELARPALERVDLIHGRVASPDEIQTSLQNAEYRQFFEHVWNWVVEHSNPAVRFAPELLPTSMGYAAKGDARRWEDSLDLLRLMEATA